MKSHSELVSSRATFASQTEYLERAPHPRPSPREERGEGEERDLPDADRLLRRLLPQPRDVICGELRWLGSEAGGDVIGDGRDFDIGIGVAERRH